MSDYRDTCPCDLCKAWRAQHAQQEAPAVETKEVPTSRLLTLEMVLKGSPCYEYRNLFRQRYGDSGVMVTVEKALSESDDWDWGWAGAYLLSRKAEAEFSRRSREANQKHDDAVRPYRDLYYFACNKYDDVRDETCRETYDKGLSYNERYALMDKASAGILELPKAAYEAARRVASKVRTEARITAFAELFILDGDAYEEEHRLDPPFVDNYDDADEEDYENDSDEDY